MIVKAKNGLIRIFALAAMLALNLAFISVVHASSPTYDLARDYSTNGNPAGVWSYGWKSNLSGAFNLFTMQGTEVLGGGQWHYWLKDGGGPSSIYYSVGPGTITIDGGQGVYPPGTVVLGPGYTGHPDSFGVARLIIPEGASGQYQIDAAVHSHKDGSGSGDTDFHIVRNGVALFDAQIGTSSGTNVSRPVSLSAGDIIDFAVGRGADGNDAGSALKIEATINFVGTNAPPPPPSPGTYDLAVDFNRDNNPSGAWSLGWKSTVLGDLHIYTVPKAVPSQEGLPIDTWSSGPETAQVEHNGNNTTVTTDGAAGVFPPGTVILGPGHEGNPDIFSVARLTIPAGGSGTYRVEIGVQSYLDGPISGDTDFHIIRNGAEIFSQFLPGNGSASYSNLLVLSEGSILDFICGNGADGQNYASALKFASRITLIETNPVPPSIITQPQSLAVTVGSAATFSVVAQGTPPLTYQWRFKGNEIPGATSASLSISNAQFADAGEYSVDVMNTVGTNSSTAAVLTVSEPPPPPIATYDLERDFPTNSNPSGVWAFGSQGQIGGAFELFPRFAIDSDPLSPNVPWEIWIRPQGGAPSVYHNGSTNLTGHCCGGAGDFPPDVVWFSGGPEGDSQNYGVIRFQVPGDGGGDYRVFTAVHSYLDGSISGDTDFHVVKNGTEIFGQFLPGSSGTSYSNTLTLAPGDIIDFVAGRGADNRSYASALKIKALIHWIRAESFPPNIVSQPHSLTVNEGDPATLTVTAHGSAPLSFQWRFNGDDITDATNSTLFFASATLDDSGEYTVVVSNDIGSTTSSPPAILTVVRPRILELGANLSQQEGTAIVLPLTLHSDGDVGGLTVNINYNATYLREPQLSWTSAVDGSFNSVNTNTLGQVRATFALPATSIPAGIQTLAHLSFYLRSVPQTLTTPVTLQILDISDANGNSLTGTVARSVQVTDRIRTITGDNNANDRLDVGDATVVLRYLSQLDPLRAWDTRLNDVNQNSSLDSGDAIRILRAASGIDPQPSGPGSPSFAARIYAADSLVVANPNAVLSPARIQTSPGQNIVVQVRLQDLASPVSGAAFRLNYDTNALRLTSSQSYHLGAIVPGNALPVWNVAPAQNNFATQNGTISLAASSASPWASNQGVLAELTFQVQAGATSQYLWPITLSSVETTEDGYINHQLASAGATVSARAPLAGSVAATGGLSGGNFTLTVSGDAGASYILEASADLKNWTTLTTIVNSTGSTEYIDTDAGNHDHRFYRARPAANQ